MSKRTVFTTITPLPGGITRETVLETLHDHIEMIDLNPLVVERHPIKPPNNADAEEYHCTWYSLTDKVSYLPGGVVTGKVTYNACFHDLALGLQTHVYAPMGLNIKGKWTLGGSLPGEPVAPVELGVGAPLSGLYLREDVDMKCNIMMTGFVKKTLKKAHSALVSRVLVRAQIVEASMENERLARAPSVSQPSLSRQSTGFSQHSSRDSNRESQLGLGLGGLGGLRNIGPVGPQGGRFDDQSSNRDEKSAAHDSALYPKPLSTRSASPSASMSGSQQNGRASYQSSLAGGPNAGPRVSWNHLGNPRSPPLNQDQGYQNANPHAYGNPNEQAQYQNANPHAYGNPHEQAQYQNAPPAYQNHFGGPNEQNMAYRQTSQQYGQAEQYQHPEQQRPAQPYPGQLGRQHTQPYPEDNHVVNFSHPHEMPAHQSQRPHPQQSQHPQHPVEME
ncbi:hypothetical protein GLAREA_02013 [Glarea lozoyensis ATCC 20868]|uniref:DUF7053 domain-containing protein n=1 Tax=Glarea lozoyensis (strain ATCC 20868 / MF5171) TaxID=1116229 RepID=S3D222_GLAL2|nr:uncharacterized protein GLAREA_02013 [Glarea lozoyensis ATCC 20868]EPE26101.1 hypothetical protein GLAREA_02013 [Glarea lozoyensis ATCC 20868]